MQVMPIANAAFYRRPRKEHRPTQETIERRYVRDEMDENAPRFVIYA